MSAPSGVLLAFLLGLAGHAEPTAGDRDAWERGVVAYRRGEYAEAQLLWERCLEAELTPEERARVARGLGNAAWRRSETLQAVGWYTIALEADPRNQDVRHNLELARSTAGLEPADRGDLASTVERLLGAWTPAEARWIAFAGLALLLASLLAEALRGGLVLRRLAFAAFFVALLLAAPWLRRLVGPSAHDPHLVLRTPAVALRSEPRRELDAIASVEAGREVERIDALPGWVRIETEDGTRGWVEEEQVFPLVVTARAGVPALRTPGSDG